MFDQATKIQGCINLDGNGYQACIYLGVKISRDDLTKKVKIYDPQKSINYYVEVDKDIYQLFLSKGWPLLLSLLIYDVPVSDGSLPP